MNISKLIFYTKLGCHLCEGLQEKLAQLDALPIELETREITENPQWFQQYQDEVPVLCRLVAQAETWVEQPLPRLSPRASLAQLTQMLQTYLGPFEAQ